MKSRTTGVPRLAAALLMTSGTILLAAPLATAQAPAPRPGANGDETCAGHLSLGAAAEGTNPVDYQFACPDKLTGYALVVNREVTGFDANVPVYQSDGTTIVPSDTFACEGSLPGFGAACDGTYSGNFNVVKGTLQLTDPVCAKASSALKAKKVKGKKTKAKTKKSTPTRAKVSVQLVVTYASGTADKTGAVTVTQSIAGPFQMPLYHHCAA